MKEFFEQLNSVLSIVAAISDFLWEVPTNWEWYKAIPVFGSFSLAVIVLVGTISKLAVFVESCVCRFYYILGNKVYVGK